MAKLGGPGEGQGQELEELARRVAAIMQEQNQGEETRQQIAQTASAVEGLAGALNKLAARIEAIEEGSQGAAEEVKQGIIALQERIPKDFCDKFPELCRLLRPVVEREHGPHTTLAEALACEHCGENVSREIEELGYAKGEGREGEVPQEAAEPESTATAEDGSDGDEESQEENEPEAEPRAVGLF